VKFLQIIRPEDIPKHKSYISFEYSEDVTAASSGRSDGQKPVWLEKWVKFNGIMHELMHLLGFFHEHQRPDRDLFCNANIDDADFSIINDQYTIGKYDPESVMHYEWCNNLKPKEGGLLTFEQMEKKKKLAKDFSKGDIDALNFIYGKMKCTAEDYGFKFLSQGFYECLDCWGKDSALGCCCACRFTCHKTHRVIHHPPTKLFFCDCGVNGHKIACTTTSTGKTGYRQPWLKCLTCFKDNDKNGVCFPCSKTCHLGHETEYRYGLKNICNCGNSQCLKECCLQKPRSIKINIEFEVGSCRKLLEYETDPSMRIDVMRKEIGECLAEDLQLPGTLLLELEYKGKKLDPYSTLLEYRIQENDIILAHGNKPGVVYRI